MLALLFVLYVDDTLVFNNLHDRAWLVEGCHIKLDSFT